MPPFFNRLLRVWLFWREMTLPFVWVMFLRMHMHAFLVFLRHAYLGSDWC
jgi:hypothetical protein